MGFTTGFTGGVTLTLSLAYLTVLAHQRNRASQSLHLHQQSYILTSLLEKQPIPPPKTRSELAREERSTLIEAAKDRWNAEIENGVRWVQRTDWEGVRDGIEGAKLKIPSYPEIERKAGGTVDAARESVRNAVSRGIEAGKDIAQKAGAAVGIAEQKMTNSDVERALRERFEGPTHLDKSVQQALEERYTPIDQRDNSTLRGL
ncbi:4521d6f7-a33a-43a7-bc9c-23f2c2f7b60d [Sclerotinia trifoliorum]|uniref:MICOS complex subunit MIC12 n=1 Tax=Sclerotinia trifoliorum TaxID=28548 RepID=A0A8H2ZQW9_9HELO|nr:4521d6f7-a33a-43a7-bc9c-23f2c2f7b60d [Sclerotinia trifoliorum]